MKKFTLLLCAVLTLCTVNAQIRQRGMEEIRTTSKKTSAKMVAQAQTSLDYEATNYITQYYSNFDVTMVSLPTEDFTFCFPFYGKTINENQTYTEADETLLDIENCYFYDDQYEYDMDQFSYKQYTDGDGGFHVTITIVSGTVTINVNYYRAPVPTKYDTIDIEIPNAKVADYLSINAYEFFGNSADDIYYAQLDYTTTGAIAGDYDENDCDLQYNLLTFDHEGQAVEIELVKVTAKVVQTEGGYTADAYYYAYNGKCYHVTFVFVEPTPKTKVNFSATNLEIDENFESLNPQIMVYASSSTYNLSLDIYTSMIEGSYNLNDLRTAYSYILDSSNNRYAFYSANLTIAKDGDAYKLTGTILCYGDVEFTLDITEGATALENIMRDQAKGKKFDVQGREIRNAQHGQMVIINGQKYIGE